MQPILPIERFQKLTSSELGVAESKRDSRRDESQCEGGMGTRFEWNAVGAVDFDAGVQEFVAIEVREFP